MSENRSEQFTARGRRDQTVEDDPDETYTLDADDAAEMGPEDIGVAPDDVAKVPEDQGDSRTADTPVEPEEVG
jgi:hypothetical protein